MQDKQLSVNFTLSEMCASLTAQYRGIKNEPDDASIHNLEILCKEVLQPARDDYGKPMHVNSGFRCPTLNKAVGGKYNSYHLVGKAADIHASGETEAFYLSALFLRSKITDLVIVEKRKRKYWVHVQWSAAPRHKLIQNYDED